MVLSDTLPVRHISSSFDHGPNVKISKLEAAERQLNCAIRMYFDEEDQLAVHTISRAAFRILYDVYPSMKDDGYSSNIEAIILQMGWKRFNRGTNFLKHALDDPDGLIDIPELDTQLGLGIAGMLLYKLTGKITPEMRAFDAWMKVTHPDQFKVPPDPDIDTEYRQALTFLKTQPRGASLVMGKTLIAYFKAHPD